MQPKASFFSMNCRSFFRYLRPRNFGHQQCLPHHTGGARITNHWVIHYVLSGTGIFQTRGQTYHPKAGDMFIIRPGELSLYAADAEDPWSYIWFDFDCDIPLPTVMEQDVISDERLREVFLSARQQVEQCPKERRDALLHGKLFELVALLETYYPNPKDAGRDIIVHKTIQYIRENYCKPITVEEMATQVYSDPSALITQFRKVTGTTPFRYMTIMRLSAATHRLLTGDFTVAEIAKQVGYEDTTSFTRTFKRHMGMSPTQFVNTYRPFFLRINET